MVDRTVADIFDEWSNRRRGILRALTTEVDDFYARCPPHREGLCLFGNPDGSWHVGPPSYEVPPIIPEPCNGINCARDSLDRLSWLAFVCAHAESWLLSVAFFRSFCLTHKQREELFEMMNQVTPLLEIVTSSQDINNRLGEPSYGEQDSQETLLPQQMVEEDADAWQDGDGDPCPLCGQHYKQGKFWICCDFCEKWYCGRCVKLDEETAGQLETWKCPSCDHRRLHRM